MAFFENPEQNKKITKTVPAHPEGGLKDGESSRRSLPRVKSRGSKSKLRTFFLYLTTAVVIVVGATIFYLNFAKKTEIRVSHFLLS